MGSLARVYAEIVQAAFHYEPCLGNVAPLHRHAQGRNAGTPAAETNQKVAAALLPEAGVQGCHFRCHLPGLQYVEGFLAQVNYIPDSLYPSRAYGAAGIEYGALRVYAVPVHLAVQSVSRYRPDLQHVEYCCGILPVEVGCELDFHPALHLLLGDFEQAAEYVRQREGVVFEYVGEGHELRSLRHR